MNEIQAELFRLQDLKYREFQSKLIPGLREDEMIGVRTPALRKYARELSKQIDSEYESKVNEYERKVKEKNCKKEQEKLTKEILLESSFY